MHRKSIWLLILAAFSAGLLMLGARDAERARLQELSPAIGAGVVEALDQQGSVEVLVSLKSPDGTPETWTRDLRRANALNREDAVLAILAHEDFTLMYRFETAAALFGSVTAAGFRKLSAHPDVAGIALNRSRGVVELGESVPLIKADLVHAIGFDGSGVDVAVIDTGIDWDHADLSDNIVREWCSPFLSTCGPPETSCASGALRS